MIQESSLGQASKSSMFCKISAIVDGWGQSTSLLFFRGRRWKGTKWWEPEYVHLPPVLCINKWRVIAKILDEPSVAGGMRGTKEVAFLLHLLHFFAVCRFVTRAELGTAFVYPCYVHCLFDYWRRSTRRKLTAHSHTSKIIQSPGKYFSLIERLGVYRCASLLLAFCISLSTLSLSLGSIPKTQRLTLQPSIESSHWLIAVIDMNVCRWRKAMLSSWQNFLDLIASRNSILRNGIETMKERLTRKRKKKKRHNFSHGMPYGSACQRQYTVM